MTVDPATSIPLQKMLDKLPPERRAAVEQRSAFLIETEIARELEQLEDNKWVAGREARQAQGPVGATSEALARSVIELLCDDPNVWLTHGMPGESKINRIKQRILQALERVANV